MQTPFAATEQSIQANLDSLSMAVQATHVVEQVLGNVRPKSKTLCNGLTRVIEKELDAIPSSTELRQYGHAAAVTQLYSIYEEFVFGLLSEWLNHLPNICPLYKDLPEEVRKAHRHGVGLVLSKTRRISQSSSDSRIVQGLYEGLGAHQTYSLSIDAFRHEHTNLRAETLGKLFSRVGLESPLQWQKSYPPLMEYFSNVWSTPPAVEAKLEALIEVRNEASHGMPNSLWAYQEWARYAQFIRILAKLLVEMVNHKYLTYEIKNQNIAYVGKVIKQFNGPVVGVMVEPGSLQEGDDLIAYAKQKCLAVQVEQIQVDMVRKARIRPRKARKIGLELSLRVSKDCDLYRYGQKL